MSGFELRRLLLLAHKADCANLDNNVEVLEETQFTMTPCHKSEVSTRCYRGPPLPHAPDAAPQRRGSAGRRGCMQQAVLPLGLGHEKAVSRPKEWMLGPGRAREAIDRRLSCVYGRACSGREHDLRMRTSPLRKSSEIKGWDG